MEPRRPSQPGEESLLARPLAPSPRSLPRRQLVGSTGSSSPRPAWAQADAWALSVVASFPFLDRSVAAAGSGCFLL